MIRRLALLFATALAAVLVVSAVGSAAATPTLSGSVGPTFVISLKMGGKQVTKLKAGTYKLVVSDKSDFHDFHLIGPGVNKVVTTVAFVGKKTLTVTLKKGMYSYQCDPHAANGMFGKFTVS